MFVGFDFWIRVSRVRVVVWVLGSRLGGLTAWSCGSRSGYLGLGI